MATTYDKASLVMIPSGVKEDKLYSIKPTDGSGDLAFSRSNDTATRVNSSGLIEKVRTNLLTYSEDFSNAAWVKIDATFSGDTLTSGAGTTFKGVYQLESTQGVQVNYFDVAYVDHQWVQILVGTGGSDLGYANFDIQNKVVGSFSGIISATIQDFGTYVRLVYAINTTNKTSINISFVDSGFAGRAASTSSTGSFKLLRAQLETGDIATDYIATTSAAVSVGPVANLPRLDYSGGASCPKLLLEPTATTLMPYSESLDNAAWTKVSDSAAITANSVTSPDGYQNADTITGTGSGVSYVLVRQTITAPSAATYTYSAFFKYNNHPFVALTQSSYDGGGVAYFNIQTGVKGSVTAGASSTIKDYGNGWYRCTLTAPIGASDLTGRPSIYVAYEDGTTDFPSTAAATGKAVYAWGFNFTQSAYATSYIPTLSAASTRGADAASKTSATALIGQTEGTIFAEFANPAKAAQGRYFSLSDGTAGNRIDVYAVSPTEIGIYAAKAFTPIVNTSFVVPSNAPLKYAIAYKAGSWAWYLNGVQIGTNTNTNVPPLSEVLLTTGATLGQAAEANPAVQALLFKTRLTNAELAALTTI